MSRNTGRATRNLEVEVLTSLTECEAVAAEWNDLAQWCSAQPFGLPALALPWWRHLGRGELRVVTARNGAGDLVGLAPLHCRAKLGLPVVAFLGMGLGAVGELLVRPSKANVADALWSELGRDRAALHLIDFKHGGAGLNQLRRSEAWETTVTVRDECPVIELDGLNHVDELLADPKRSGLRKKLARARRDLGEATVDLEVSATPADVVAHWDRLAELYDRSEREHPRLHLGRAPYDEFFRQALVGLAEQEQVSILSLAIDGRYAAFDVYVHGGSTVYAIVGRMDPAFARFSPGQLLLQEAAQWAIEARAQRIDLQLGADEYKLRWSDHTYDTVGVVAAPPGRLAATRLALGGIESAYDGLRAVRSNLGRLRR